MKPYLRRHQKVMFLGRWSLKRNAKGDKAVRNFTWFLFGKSQWDSYESGWYHRVSTDKSDNSIDSFSHFTVPVNLKLLVLCRQKCPSPHVWVGRKIPPIETNKRNYTCGEIISNYQWNATLYSQGFMPTCWCKPLTWEKKVLQTLNSKHKFDIVTLCLITILDIRLTLCNIGPGRSSL